ncbi:MAG: type II/IV secretion system protein [Acidovorax sp.]|nr:type II/IV secretion system protein [Acidovorax sp.]
MTQNAPQPNTAQRPPDLDALWALVGGLAAARQPMRHLGQALLRHGLVSHEQLQAALHAQAREPQGGARRQLGQLLVDSGVLTQEQLRQAIAAWLGEHTIDPALLTPDPTVLALVPRAVAEQHAALPLMLRGDTVVMLMDDPWDRRVLDQMRFMTQRRIVAALAAPGSLMPAIQKAYRVLAGDTATPRAKARDLAVDLDKSASAPAVERADATVSESDNALVRLVNSVIEEAIAQGASDIHVETEPAPRNVRIRLRIDGDLQPCLELQARFRYALVARLKIMSGLDISEHRKPQDGKIDFARFGGSKVELRMVTIPTHQGLEDVVLRVLAHHKPLPLDQIGLNATHLAQLRGMAKKTYGLILVCGPTGSGKTTTLHSVIRDINTAERKIWTAENPIEITQEGLRQVEVNPRIGWTFAAAMRAFLRADPDVIMIGEMRDEETASIAIEASLTGHMVMSTLHTNSAPESITRLLEIGMDPFTFSDSLLAILAQRLVRRLCTHCRQRVPATAEALGDLALQYLASSHATAPTAAEQDALVARWQRALSAPQNGADGAASGPGLWQRVGCAHCDGSGYRGRLGIHELMLSDDTIRAHIRHRAPAQDLRTAALAAGMKTLRQDGIDKVLQGLTDLHEVLAATNQ